MNETIRTHIAALNAAWQRYVRTANEQLDPATAEALNRDYVNAWERLDGCGIAEWILKYDPATVTFSLPSTQKMIDGEVLTNLEDASRGCPNDSDRERMQLI